MASKIVQAGLEKASEMELRDFTDERLAKASAMLHQTYGEGGEAFRMKGDADQDACLWAIAGLLDEAIASQEEFDRRAPKIGQVVDGDEAEVVKLFRLMDAEDRARMLDEARGMAGVMA